MIDPAETDRSREAWLADAAASRIETVERLKFQVAFTDGALKALMLTNGGALVALFTFLANIAGKDAPIHLKPGFLWPAFGCFALGLGMTLFASLGAFMSQGSYYRVSQLEAEAFRDMAITGERRIPDPDPRAQPLRQGTFWEVGGTAAATAAVVLFVIGCALALKGVI